MGNKTENKKKPSRGDILRDGGFYQATVLYALILRETRTRFGAHSLGYLWALAEPLLWILTFFLAFYMMGRQMPHGMDIFSFMVTGLLPFFIFKETMMRCSQAINSNRALLFFPQIVPLNLVLARGILEWATAITVTIILWTGYLMVAGDNAIMPDQPLLALLAISWMAAMGVGIGLCLCMLGLRFPVLERLIPTFNRPLFWISGLFFTTHELPSAAQTMLWWNPLLHGVELCRYAYFSSYPYVYFDIAYLSIWTLAPLALGLLLERGGRKHIRLS